MVDKAPEYTLEVISPEPKYELEVKGQYKFEDIVEKAAKRYGLDPRIIHAVIQHESSYNPGAKGAEVNGDFAGGLMQLMSGTAKEMGVEDRFDPEQNILGGARYLRHLFDLSGGDMTKALMWYHGGRDPKQWGDKSFAYPGIVMDTYQKLGGREYPADLSWLAGARSIPRGASKLDIAANAAVPFVSAPELIMEGARQIEPAVKAAKEATGEVLEALPRRGSMNPMELVQSAWRRMTEPDFWWKKPQASFAEIYNRGNAQSPSLLDPINRLFSTVTESALNMPPTGAASRDIENFRDSLAVTRAQKPGEYAAYSMLGSVPGQVALGLAGHQAAAALPGQAGAALTGTTGYGRPVTGEGASWLARRGGEAAAGGYQGALGALGLAHVYPETPIGEQVLRGTAAGAIAGPLVGAATEHGANFLFGSKIDPSIARLGQQARGTRPAESGYSGEPLELRSAPLAPNNIVLSDPKQFSRLAWETAGAKRPPVTQEEVQALGDTVGGKIDAAARRLVFRADRRMQRDIAALGDTFDDATLAQTPIQRALRSIYAKLDAKQELTGVDYQSLVQRGSPLANAAKSTNPEVQRAARALRNILDDALTRETQRNVQVYLRSGQPEAAAELAQSLATFRQARAEYRNFATLAEAKDPLTENILIDRLAAAIPRHFGNINRFSSGRLGELARYGLAFNPAQEASVFAPGAVDRNLGFTLAAATAQPYPTLVGRTLALGGRALKNFSGRAPWAVPELLARSVREGPTLGAQVMRAGTAAGAADVTNALLGSPPSFQEDVRRRAEARLPTLPSSWVPQIPQWMPR